MKNISLHAPLNDTNRNWERALIKKANSGGSSTPQKGVYNIELHSYPVDDYIEYVEAEPELIANPAMPNISVYHIETRENYSTTGYAILHEFNDLKIFLEVEDYSGGYYSEVSASISDGDTLYLMKGKYDYSLDTYTVSYEYVKDTYLQDTIADCEHTLIRYAFNNGGGVQ